MANELKHKDVGTVLTEAEYDHIEAHQFDSQATGDIAYASSADQLSRLAIGSTGAILTVTGGLPVWDTSPTFTGAVTVGADDTGYDVQFFGDTASRYWLWDTSADGVVQRGTLTVGVDDTGHDVKFFGATAGQYLLWDESADELVLAGDSKLSFHDAAGGENIIASADGHLEVNAGTTLDITAPTVDLNSSTEFNIDTAAYDLNASGTVAVDGAVISLDSTTSLNIDNSNTSNGITIGTATSAVPISIGHATSETTVNDNLTVTGDLTVSGTQTVVDTVTMNAANAVVFEGATADAYETTLTIEDPTADRTVVIPNNSGTLPLLAADSDTAITSTPAELNLIDGGTARGTDAVASGDGILINDAGTMKMTNVDTVSTYFAGHSVGGTNIVTTGALDTGSITSGFTSIDVGAGAIAAGSFDASDGNITNVGDIQLDSITGDGDTNTNITFAGSDVTTFTTGGAERMRINSAGDVHIATGTVGGLIVGHTARIATNLNPNTQILGDDDNESDGSLLLGTSWTADGGASAIHFVKSGHGTWGSFTTVADNELLGRIRFLGDDATDYATAVVDIEAYVDDSSVATGQIGGELRLKTATTGGVMTNALLIDRLQQVHVDAGTGSTGSTSGALIVDGGIGVAGDSFFATDIDIGSQLAVGNTAVVANTNIASVTNTSDGTDVTAGFFRVFANSQSTVTPLLIAVDAEADNATSSGYNTHGDFSSGDGFIGVRSKVTVTGGAGSEVGDAAAFYVKAGALAGGSWDAQYGLYIESLTAATLDYAIYMAGTPLIHAALPAASAATNISLDGSNNLQQDTSSIIFKEEVRDMVEWRSILTDLHPADFVWKSGVNVDAMVGRDDFGFIAQETAAVDRRLATYKDGEPWSVRYMLLTAPLVAGWQEHDQRLDEIERKLKDTGEV